MEGKGSPQGSQSGAGRILAYLVRGLRDMPQAMVGRRREKRLRLRETLSLGERRFLAVVEFDQQEFLVGGTGSSLALLTRVEREPTPRGTLHTGECCQSQAKKNCP